MNPLNVLTEEQIKSLSEEQLLKLANFKSLDDVIIEYNDLLCDFLKTLYFCPHDSEYRLKHTNEEDDNIRALLEKILSCQKLYHLDNKVYVYCKNHFKLDSYSYKNENIYSGTKYFIVSQSEFHKFCQQKSLNYENFIIPKTSCDDYIKNPSFTNWMNKQHNYVYILPHGVDITCYKTADEFGHNYANRVNIFKDMQFIDVLKLKDYL